MKCEEVREIVSKKLAAIVTRAERVAIFKHVMGCRACVLWWKQERPDLIDKETGLPKKPSAEAVRVLYRDLEDPEVASIMKEQ